MATKFQVPMRDLPAELTVIPPWTPAPTLEGLVAQGRAVSVLSRKEKLGPDINGLQELLVYGIKGAAAYADHAQILGQEAEAVYAFFAEALAWAGPDDLICITGSIFVVAQARRAWAVRYPEVFAADDWVFQDETAGEVVPD
jgi:hypothetical protein